MQSAVENSKHFKVYAVDLSIYLFYIYIFNRLPIVDSDDNRPSRLEGL